ncbi:MAG: hypothetical protein IJ783_00745 [Kiritimatiellae bacterium]|nr:hypothetical protein [Kiritimatiellia bacterium]
MSSHVDCEVKSVASGTSFRVQANVGASFSEATTHMLRRFSMMSAKHPLPSLDPQVAAIGDLAYTGWNTNVVDSMYFVRNNVFIRVRSGDETQSALPLSQMIDEQLSALSTNAVSARPASPDRFQLR